MINSQVPCSSTAVLLAAGLGTRMRSALPKAMQPLAGQPMLSHLIASAARVFDRVVVVIGPDMEDVVTLAAPHVTVVQHDRLGTAHAALQAEALFGDGDVAVLYADNPLITPETLSRLLATRRAGIGAERTDLALLAMRPADPGRYGRVIAGSDGIVEKIVEWADATEAERDVDLCNAGVLCAEAGHFRKWLHRVGNANAKGEYYLTDVVAIARNDGAVVRAVEAPESELRGINSRVELAEAETIVQRRLRNEAMLAGVTLTAPETVFLSFDTLLEPDVVVQPHVVFGPGVTVRSGAEIRAFSHLEGCEVGPRALVGPYARLRPGSTLGEGSHVGNFVELKGTTLGAGAKANHLTYLGDSSIGAGSNIGAGTITCNYDGVFKHRTTIGENTFIGSDSILVAPVTIGDGALIAAGSVITQDVAPDALAVARGMQVNKPGWAARFRTALRAKKEQG
ncbi:bifunctional UDP-N-acetylglucosamine diphosphorylase/glucosamine-1-phosphate N-acetyltransferase GlmU [Acetobacter fallax]|uniref:Bifunctional protein GlmU n=1 Tax=Acetobacter fallax TaxID=1737473 RepID=A0ABX0KCY3_9PROT|nr:bifunctional UDP-N-acetylglucosamine diphosphorylase/glucosamine-1-phosphate N-acetyltransferase GlmU [Acetobacter fallax]NHO33018.1 bifunctional UDP-N-acetylglucosamine diphosphorylase/glucosamine-1-phosphate N-acetyltransferase GlmU [Acetobacter fallax]NHO36614.1 bifunctional UDP-N-acetylglucosamine diphosphorylase/glucosamine-1-phosphate N-acetyltransferase GlmU [Acetobacter fallax]